MQEQDIDELIGRLNWDSPRGQQKQAIEELCALYNALWMKLIRPNGKENWENAAAVLQRIGCPVNEIIVPKMLEWLKDMNWPGALRVREVLKTISPDSLLPFIEDALRKAKQESDSIWIAWIKELLEYLSIPSESLSQDAREILSHSTW